MGCITHTVVLTMERMIANRLVVTAGLAGLNRRLTMKCDINAIRKQSEFCLELMRRLNVDIKTAGEKWGVMEHHIRKMDDAKRLRRELIALSKMLDPWSD